MQSRLLIPKWQRIAESCYYPYSEYRQYSEMLELGLHSGVQNYAYTSRGEDLVPVLARADISLELRQLVRELRIPLLQPEKARRPGFSEQSTVKYTAMLLEHH